MWIMLPIIFRGVVRTSFEREDKVLKTSITLVIHITAKNFSLGFY